MLCVLCAPAATAGSSPGLAVRLLGRETACGKQVVKGNAHFLVADLLHLTADHLLLRLMGVFTVARLCRNESYGFLHRIRS